MNIEGDKVIIGTPTWGPWPLFTRSVGETLYYMKCYRVLTNVAYVAKREKAVDVNLFHQRFGHPSKYYTEKTAELYGIRLKGKMKST